MKTNIFICLLVILSVFNLKSQNYILDNTFATNGLNINSFDSMYDYGAKIAKQSNGKILVAVISAAVLGDPNNTSCDAKVYRFNIDGSLDNTFGIAGHTLIGGYSQRPEIGLAVQADDKILLSFSHLFEGADIIRYNPDGEIDLTFSSDGYANNIGLGLITYQNNVLIQNDHKIIITGCAYRPVSAEWDYYTGRYLEDGSIDSTYGTNGSTVSTKPSANDYSLTSVMLPDNSVIQVGYEYPVNKVHIEKYLANGNLDNSYGVNGEVDLNPSTFNDYITSSVIQPDGKLVLAGYNISGSVFSSLVIRLMPNGDYDNSFGTGGIYLEPTSTYYSYINGVAMTADGNILISGGRNNIITGESQGIITQLLPNGTVDYTFGLDGVIVTYSDIAEEIYNYAMISESDNKILTTGMVSSIDYTNTSLARYTPTFGVGIDDFKRNTAQVLIYPNPVEANSNFMYTLENSGIVTLSLYSLSGEKLYDFINSSYRNKGDNQEIINIPTNIPIGEYLLKLNANNKNAILKIFKK